VPSSLLSPDLADWFSGSKIVDQAGNPLLLLHGTPFSFDRFDAARARRGPFGTGFHFVNDQGLATQYALGREPVRAYLRLLKPYLYDLAVPFADRLRAGRVFRDGDARAVLQARGFDGVLVTDGDYIEVLAFSPEQIRIVRP
jgi:hypothetical protein